MEFLGGNQDIFSLTSELFSPLFDASCLIDEGDFYLRFSDGSLVSAKDLFVEYAKKIVSELHSAGHISDSDFTTMNTEVDSWW